MNIIGVCGENGKTTTAHFLHAILQAPKKRAGLLSTILWDAGGTLLPGRPELPEPKLLKTLLTKMDVHPSAAAVIRIPGTDLPRIPLVGAVATDGRIPGRLLESLPSAGFVVVPVAAHVGRTDARVVRYAVDQPAEMTGTILSSTFQGTRFRLEAGSASFVINCRLIGTHNAQNALAAACGAWTMGYDAKDIQNGIQRLCRINGRMHPVSGQQKLRVLVDYARTPEQLAQAGAAARSVTSGRIILVFGAGGETDADTRKALGAVSQMRGDLTIITSTDPRHENPLTIITDIEAGCPNKAKYLIEPDRRAAIKLAVALARAEDTILVLGKGHETMQVMNYGPRPFNDVEVVQEALNNRVRGKA